jgi:hypothetical protein
MFALIVTHSSGDLPARACLILLGSALAAFSCWSSAIRGAEDPVAARIVSKARVAAGFDALLKYSQGIVVEGRAREDGEDGELSLQFRPTGEFIRTITGRLGSTTAYDGASGWGVDWSGLVRRLELRDLEVEQLPRWVQTGCWLLPEGPVDVQALEGRADSNNRLRLRIKGGLMEAELLLDRETGLPDLLTHRYLGLEETWRFSDYRVALGCRLPHKLVHSYGGLTDEEVWMSFKPAPVAELNPFRAPSPARSEDTTFDHSASPRVSLKKAASGHLLFRPAINGWDLGWFILDSGCGAGMLIRRDLADQLAFPSLGEISRAGAGRSFRTRLRKGERFTLGPITIARTFYSELPPETAELMNRACGVEIAGVAGYDLFRRAVVALDQEGLTIAIHDPDRYQLSSGRWEDLSLSERISAVHCRFDGEQAGLFRVDTGAGSGPSNYVVFHAPAVTRLRLLEGRESVPLKVGGAGGFVDARMATLREFTVGGHKFNNVSAIMPVAQEGALADPYTLGTFGGRMLSPFEVVFDYPHQRIAFVAKVADGN